jgi:hypothetical protein
MPTTAKPKLYNPRHPERTLLYQTVAEHYETWLELASAGQFDGQCDHHTPKPLCARRLPSIWNAASLLMALPALVAVTVGTTTSSLLLQRPGVCPSCTTRRLETAAHLSDHVFPRLPVRQWVLSVPKRLRYFMQRDGAVLSMVLRIFLRVIAQTLQTHSPGAAHMDKAGLHIGAIAFIHRFGSSLTNTSTSTFVLWTGCLRKWRARAMLMRPLESHRRVSSFTRPPASMRLPWPQCRPHCKTHPARLRCSGPAGEL